MELQTISFVIGATLLVVAILGGGIEIKEIKIPTADKFARILSGVVGTVFIFIGLWTGGFFPLDKETVKTSAIPVVRDDSLQAIETRPSDVKVSEAAAEQIHFTLQDSLGKTGDEEEIETMKRIYLEGKQVANILLNLNTPSQSESVSLKKPGEYRYYLEGYTVWNTNPDLRIPITGSGVISVERGSAYEVWATSPPTAELQTWEVELRNK